MKISAAEPAERELTIALSKAEVLALAVYHISQAKRVTRKVGKLANEMLALKKSARELKAAVEVAKSMSDAHIARARGLSSLLK